MEINNDYRDVVIYRYIAPSYDSYVLNSEYANVKGSKRQSGDRRCGNTAERLTTPPAKEDDVAKPDDTSKPTPPRTLEEVIEYERTLLLQVRSILHCLYEVLLYADDDDSVMHAEVAQTAARLLNESAVRLDAVNLQPLIEAVRKGSGAETAYEDKRDVTRDGPHQVKEAVPMYLAA
jgi:hypothetical protein